ncbi:MAG: acyl-ACP--UDP-N-acetylglucosamine O-acyltransferase [Nitrospinota bacterium]|nr:acyl-ACP--UDP-N-acetylglucosamine O-acyltransferase [Nitrospinota bacterium]
MNIHPTAIVDKKAQLGENVLIGPFSQIGAKAVIGDNSEIGSNVILDRCSLGRDCIIGHCTIIGGLPQSIGIDRNIDSRVLIGNKNTIGEHVGIHRGSKVGGATTIGDENFIMSMVHIGHDCHICNNTIITTFAGFSGHGYLGNRAVVGGNAGVHQFVRIGEMAMVGAMCKAVKDIPPYFMVEGVPAAARGLNTVGLKRSGVTVSEISAIKKAYKLMCRSEFNLSQAVEKIKADLEMTEQISNLLKFIEESERGVTL